METDKDVELSLESVSTICRACLLKCDELLCLMEVNNSEHYKYSDLYFLYCGILVEKDDALPSNICSVCINTILNFHKFKLKCVNSEERLKNQNTKGFVSLSSTINNDILSDEDKLTDTEPSNEESVSNPNTSCDKSEISFMFKKYEIEGTSTKRGVDNKILEKKKTKSFNKKVRKIKAVRKQSRQAVAKSEGKTQIDKKYNCFHCDLKFEVYNDFIEHRKEFKHPRNTPLRCPICKEKFGNKSDLSTHLNSLHATEKPYQCDICGIKFFWANNKSRHMRTHKGEKSYVCQICGKGFYQSNNLKVHALLHEESRVCPHCGVDVKSSAYKDHISRHEANFKCSQCDKVFPTRFSLSKHNLVHEESVVCTYCGDNVKESVYKGHISKHEGSFKCLECGEISPTKSALAKHLSEHREERKYLCNICGKSFKNNSGLQYHMEYHLEGKPFVCKICGKNYASQMSLRTHLLLHSGTKRYKCNECDKCFTQQHHWKTHMRTHTGERPYACSFCGKTFAQVANLKVHERLHTGETPFVCDVCSKGFPHSTSMKKHRETHYK